MKSKTKKILIKNFQSPGDILMLTAAVRDLKNAHPDLEIFVHTAAKSLWENNPYVTFLDKSTDIKNIKIINAEYPLIHKSNTHPYHFIHGFRMYLEDKLQLSIPQGPFKGDIYLSNDEKNWSSQLEEMNINQNFWIVMGGGKYDFTAKWWNPDYLQQVVDHFKNKILFVQCGEANHFNPILSDVLNLIGRTDLRQFVRLMYHASGVLCPVTFAMHLAAAVEINPKRCKTKNRPCVVVAGGREPSTWEAYTHHRYLHTMGSLDCCDSGGCWKSRCMKVGDGDKKDTENLCIYPTPINLSFKMPNSPNLETLYVPKCMNMIKPHDVISAIESYIGI